MPWLFPSAVSGLCFTFSNGEMPKNVVSDKWKEREIERSKWPGPSKWNDSIFCCLSCFILCLCLPSPVIVVKSKNAIMYLCYMCRWSTPRWYNLCAAFLMRNLLESRVLIDHRLCGEIINSDLTSRVTWQVTNLRQSPQGHAWWLAWQPLALFGISVNVAWRLRDQHVHWQGESTL